jgi:hypothetical protein
VGVRCCVVELILAARAKIFNAKTQNRIYSTERKPRSGGCEGAKIYEGPPDLRFEKPQRTQNRIFLQKENQVREGAMEQDSSKTS